jgi:hypothetical protein
MRQAAKTLAAIAMIATSGLATVSPAAFDAELDGIGLDMAALAPIETFVDWLEAAYGGPLGTDKRR